MDRRAHTEPPMRSVSRKPASRALAESGVSTLLGVQRQAGNAVARALVKSWAGQSGSVPFVQRVPPSNISRGLSDAVRDLHESLVLKNRPNVPAVLERILLMKGHQKDLEELYQSTHKRDLVKDLESKLSWDDYVRADAYLKYGRLRAADKIYIAIKRPLADEATILRAVQDIHKQSSEDAEAEAEFKKDYASRFAPLVARLPNGKDSSVMAAISVALGGLSVELEYKLAAILAFGKVRPVDNVVIATAAKLSTNTQLLFDALQSDEPTRLKEDFKTSYPREAGGSITAWITDRTSLHTENRALMLLDENVKPHERLVKTIEIATSGYTLADFDFILDAVLHATSEQVEYLKVAIASKDPRVKNLYSGLGSMTKEDASRFDALVGVGDNTGMLGDPQVLNLRKQGGTGAGSVYQTLKNATGASHAGYRTAYFESGSKFRTFVDQYTSPPEKGWLSSMVLADFMPRLNFAMDNPGNDEYVLFLINEFATAEQRTKLGGDAAFGARFNAQSTATKNKILLALRPDSMTPQERAVWLDAAVKRETASGAGSLTSTADALTDENRELQAAIKRAGANPSAADQEEIDRLAGKTEEALKAFAKYRDELEALITSAVEAVAMAVAAVATGGAAAVEFTLAAIARAAIASAVAKVVAGKLVKGDRFDVLGADGAQAFVSGAVDGVLNAVAPFAGQAAVEKTAAAAARVAAPKAFGQFAAGTAKKMTEGALVGGLGAAVDSATRDSTWAGGFDAGVSKALSAALTGAVMGGGMAVLPPALQALATAYGGLDQLEAAIDSLEKPTMHVTEGVINLDAAKAKAPSNLKVQRNYGGDYEEFVMNQLMNKGIDGLPTMLALVSGQYESGNGIDAMGFAFKDGNLEMYVFEMKWRDLPTKKGAGAPAVRLKDTPTKGRIQTDYEWAMICVDEFIASKTVGALQAKNQLRMLLPRLLGVPGTRWTNEELRGFLQSRINMTSMRRVIAVPPWADLKQLYKQLIAMRRRGQGGYKVVKTGP